MSASKLLAASAAPLAEVLVRRLKANGKSFDKLLNMRVAPAVEQADLPLVDSCSESPATAPRPDDVAAAIMLGRAFEKHRDALACLQKPDAVTVLRVPDIAFIEPLERVLHRCVFGALDRVVDSEAIGNPDGNTARLGAVALFLGDDMAKASSVRDPNSHFVSAVMQRYAVIGIASDPERQLPSDLVRLATATVMIPAMDDTVVASVIETLTGVHPGAVDHDLAKRMKPIDLLLAVRGDIGAQGSLARLQRLLSTSKNSDEAPSLASMHGLAEAKDWGLDLIADMKAYMAGQLPWADVNKSVLLVGPPGVGKTSFVRALQIPGVHLSAVSVAQWLSSREGHLGHVLQAMRRTFSVPRPAIIFIDEIDALPARSTSGSENSGRENAWWDACNACLLELLDGFEKGKNEGICVIAACNDVRKVDPALRRAARLDHVITIQLPDPPALAQILRQYVGDELASIYLLPVALIASGGTGADAERFARIARRKARIAGRAMILDDLMRAVRDGRPEMSTDLRRRAALHEAGHAVAFVALDLGHPLTLSIHASGGGAKNTTGVLRAQTRSHIEDVLVVALAGRASEQIFYGEVTAGAGGDASSDLAHATHLALKLETSFGLGDQGPLWWPDDEAHALLRLSDVRASVRLTIERAAATAHDLLAENRDAVAGLAEALFDRGYLDRHQIQGILVKTPVKAVSRIVRSAEMVSPATAPVRAQHLEPSGRAVDVADPAGATRP